jgi:SAM-dependent methyltransferase
MSRDATDTAFAGSIPELYERLMVPLVFAPYARDLAARVSALPGVARVLEVAAGTGVVTRELAANLPAGVGITATDLNAPMLAYAGSVGTARPVEWRTADAMALPFADAAFDVVVCQFGVMFFPDRPHAFAEARRVLGPGGTLLFNAWDRIEDNEIADEVTRALAAVFPDDPPRFLARTPHGYHDPARIAADLAAGGFGDYRIDTVAQRSRAPDARAAAIAYCQGTPLRNEIESRDAARLGEATRVVEDALARRFGATGLDARMQALVVEAKCDRR